MCLKIRVEGKRAVSMGPPALWRTSPLEPRPMLLKPRRNLRSNTDPRPAGPQDTVVYTRTYVGNSKSPKDGYQEDASRKYIQTVYSTSDRSVIERDMCTYCRKPLGTNTKMILDELQICCHSTCFKCEVCKQSLENLKAGVHST
uniref:Putative scel protein n=1 Tax=Ixodes ricinus TaxID=34613 RepID=A0A0K8RIF7_IXORI